MTEPKSMTINMRDATASQLAKFASEILGLNVTPQLGRDKIIAKIEAAGHQPDTAASDRTITLQVEPDSPTATQVADKSDDKGGADDVAGLSIAEQQARQASVNRERDARIVTINIARTDEAGGDEMVPVGVNGIVMAIPRGQPAPIRWPYFVALLHAVKHIHEPKGPNREMDPNPRKVPVYPFTILDGPEEAHEMMRREIAA